MPRHCLNVSSFFPNQLRFGLASPSKRNNFFGSIKLDKAKKCS